MAKHHGNRNSCSKGEKLRVRHQNELKALRDKQSHAQENRQSSSYRSTTVKQYSKESRAP